MSRNSRPTEAIPPEYIHPVHNPKTGKVIYYGVGIPLHDDEGYVVAHKFPSGRIVRIGEDMAGVLL